MENSGELTVEQQDVSCRRTHRDVCLEAHTPAVHSLTAALHVSAASLSAADPAHTILNYVIVSIVILLSAMRRNNA